MAIDACRLFSLSALSPQSPVLSPILIRSAHTEHRARGAEEDFEVEADGPILGVVNIEADHLLEGEVAAARNLPKAGEAGRHIEALPVPDDEPR